jgi:hypothetical protein
MQYPLHTFESVEPHYRTKRYLIMKYDVVLNMLLENPEQPVILVATQKEPAVARKALMVGLTRCLKAYNSLLAQVGEAPDTRTFKCVIENGNQLIVTWADNPSNRIPFELIEPEVTK